MAAPAAGPGHREKGAKMRGTTSEPQAVGAPAGGLEIVGRGPNQEEPHQNPTLLELTSGR